MQTLNYNHTKYVKLRIANSSDIDLFDRLVYLS